MSRIRGVSETASQPMITVWCAKGQHNVKIASQALVGLIQRQGCESCREKEFLGAPVVEVEVVDANSRPAGSQTMLAEVAGDWAKTTQGESMARKSTKADKEIAERNKDEEDAFQGALPGMQPAEQMNRPDIEAAAIALDRAKTKATKAGVTKKDCNDTLDGLMKHYKLAEYVLSDGRFVRPRGELHFDVVKENTGRRKKAKEEDGGEEE